MRKSLGLRLVLLVSAIAFPALLRGDVRLDRVVTIPLIDRSDPGYSDALFYLDRRALNTLLGTSNLDLDRAEENQVRLAQAIARARLSQSAYEASSAQVDRRGDQSVVISVPSYALAGDELRRHVLRDLLGNTADPKLQNRIEKFFGHFGSAEQTLTVSRGSVEVDGKSMAVYYINHEIRGPGALTLTLGSTLPLQQLATYAPFARLFPAP